MIAINRLDTLLSRFPRLTIGLVGDLFLDRYLEIDAELGERSIETGLEAFQVTRIRNQPGALGTVINNLAALGVGSLVPVSVLGDDGQAYDLLKALGPLRVDPRAIVQDRERMTPTYTKPLRRGAGGEWEELNRIDLRNRQPLSADTEQRVMELVENVFYSTDGLIVLDQVNETNWGVVNDAVRHKLGQLAKASPERLIFSDSRAHIGRFDFGTLKPNLPECQQALGLPRSDDPEAARDAVTQWSRLRGQRLFCTLGQQGMLVVRPSEPATHVPAFRVTGPIDIVGAGDSATAGIVTSLLAGASDEEAAAVGNLVASITIQQLGTTGTASPSALRSRCEEAASQAS